MKRLMLVIIILLLLLAAALWWFWFRNKWVELSPTDSDLGASVHVVRDYSLKPNAPRSQWGLWVVLQNLGPEPVNVAFRTATNHVEYKRSVQIGIGEMVALRVGPEDVDFLFRRIKPEDPEPLMPKHVGRFTTTELEKKHPLVSRL